MLPDEDAIERCCELVPLCAILVHYGEWTKSEGASREDRVADEFGLDRYGSVTIVPLAEHYEPTSGVRAMEAILERTRRGVATYGHPLRPYNGRDSLQDAVEECADLLQYLLNAQAEKS
jgi:hypothetical protein